MSVPTVSVVIPAYKAECTIRRALDSVLAQTVPVHEIIVVDDGSPDDQSGIIAEYGPLVTLIRQPNGKTAKARNTGLEAATGEFVAFLDADDYWEPTKLERQLAVFESHADVAMVSGRFVEQEPSGDKHTPALHERARISWDCVLRARGVEAFYVATRMWTGTVLVRREAIGDKRFVTGLEPAEDRDFWVRIVQEYPVYFCSEPLATYVLEPNSISRSGIERDCKSMLKVVERHESLLGRSAAREWKSYVLFRWAANEDSPSRALLQLFKSFWLWPAPYYRAPNRRPFRRFTRLAVLALALLGRRPRHYVMPQAAKCGVNANETLAEAPAANIEAAGVSESL